jgi:hypothetical protein
MDRRDFGLYFCSLDIFLEEKMVYIHKNRDASLAQGLLKRSLKV